MLAGMLLHMAEAALKIQLSPHRLADRQRRVAEMMDDPVPDLGVQHAHFAVQCPRVRRLAALLREKRRPVQHDVEPAVRQGNRFHHSRGKAVKVGVLIIQAIRHIDLKSKMPGLPARRYADQRFFRLMSADSSFLFP